MKSTTPLALIVLALTACQPVDNGGSVADYMAMATRARTAHEVVDIRGDCLSACVVKFMSGVDVRVAPDARIGVHETRLVMTGQTYSQAFGNLFGSSMVRALVRPCVRSLFPEEAWFRERLTIVPGTAILAACPEIAKL